MECLSYCHSTFTTDIVSTIRNSFDRSWAKDFIFHEDIFNSALLQKFASAYSEYLFQVKSPRPRNVIESLCI